jgi:NADH dehydrogenase/putative oxidoreductase
MTSTTAPHAQPDPRPLAEERLSPFVRVTLRRWAKWYAGGAELFWPFTDLVIRLFVAQAFFRSGMIKAMDWDTALYLAANEYPVSWLDPTSAAVIGLGIELVGPLLLVAGLFTRPVALAMAALTLVSQAVYVPTTTNLVVSAILLWLALAGPAAFSLDRALAAGVRDSALPLARPVIMAGDWLREHAAPVFMLAIRVWLAAA